MGWLCDQVAALSQTTHWWSAYGVKSATPPQTIHLALLCASEWLAKTGAYTEEVMAAPSGKDFGFVIKAWFAKNEWPQVVAEQVARAKGSKIGPWASQMSNCMQGKLSPKPDFFVAMGWFNNVILTRDFQGITDRRLMDRLLGSEALTHEDGQPFTASDFFSLFIGELKIPSQFSQAEVELTQDQVDDFWNEIRLAFRELALEMMTDKVEVWNLIAAALQKEGIHQDEIDWVREAMVGLIKPTVAECQRQRAKHPNMPLLNVLIDLKGKYGGNQERLGKYEIGSISCL